MKTKHFCMKRYMALIMAVMLLFSAIPHSLATEKELVETEVPVEATTTVDTEESVANQVPVSFVERIVSAEEGSEITLTEATELTEHIPLNVSVVIRGAQWLDCAGYAIYLNDTDASIQADGDINVASAVDGFVAKKIENTYKLVEIPAPLASYDIAGCKVEKMDEIRYLFLDLDPVNGMTLNTLSDNLVFPGLDTHKVTFSIEGNDGTDLVKTADQLVVIARNETDTPVARMTATVIVMGDTNCNGKVNSSDATILKNINFGEIYSMEVCLAADANLSGTLAEPKVNSSDAAYIMDKWFAWGTGKYTSNLK